VPLGDGSSLATQHCAVFLRFDKDSWSGDLDEVELSGEEGGIFEGLSSSPVNDTPTASWGADENLFCATVGLDDDDGGISSYPSGFDDHQALAMNEDASLAGRLAFAAMESENASETPGNWSVAFEQYCTASFVIRGSEVEEPPPEGVMALASHHYRMRRAG
jgi:hypothetical protein